MEKVNKESILTMARGAFIERADYEMTRVVDNILDPNTKATEKREIVLTIKFIPDDDRQKIEVSVTAKSKLASTNPVKTSLAFTGDENGELVLVELVPQIPGQLSLDGTEQEKPRILNLAAAAKG